MSYIFSLLRPSLCAKSILEIDEVVLNNPKIKIVLIDVDNTIIPYKKEEIQSSFMHWLISISRKKKVVLITNSSRKRIRNIPQLNNFTYICRASKPLPFCYMKALKKCKVRKDAAIIIGDQVFDDILGGNLIGIYTILVQAIEKEKAHRIRIKRYLETLVLNRMEINIK